MPAPMCLRAAHDADTLRLCLPWCISVSSCQRRFFHIQDVIRNVIQTRLTPGFHGINFSLELQLQPAHIAEIHADAQRALIPAVPHLRLPPSWPAVLERHPQRLIGEDVRVSVELPQYLPVVPVGRRRPSVGNGAILRVDRPYDRRRDVTSGGGRVDSARGAVPRRSPLATVHLHLGELQDGQCLQLNPHVPPGDALGAFPNTQLLAFRQPDLGHTGVNGTSKAVPPNLGGERELRYHYPAREHALDRLAPRRGTAVRAAPELYDADVRLTPEINLPVWLCVNLRLHVLCSTAYASIHAIVGGAVSID
mmetsp:Transcript_46445/g.140674  ORF Transcript_46445/g.140674 Transcript_46445/m.140674 type:complete len:308 (+) Transcript_46445:1470-2393(+)